MRKGKKAEQGGEAGWGWAQKKFSIMWSQWLEKAWAPVLAQAVQSLRGPGPSCRVMFPPVGGASQATPPDA